MEGLVSVVVAVFRSLKGHCLFVIVVSERGWRDHPLGRE